jgi:phospholipase C
MLRRMWRCSAPSLALIVGVGSAGACTGSDPCHPADACRQRCAFGSGDLPSATLADFGLHGTRIPIDHFVLVMQENRTFDHYFSSLTVPGQTLDGAAPNASNPDPTHPGSTISRFHQTAYCFDNPAESWDQVHAEIDGGALDGFTTQNALSDPANDPTGARAMGYYDQTDLPYYYALAQAFAISDRHFSSVQANSWPNRAFYMAGTSYGIIDDSVPTQTDAKGDVLPNLFTRLNDAHVTWSFYVQDVPSLAILDTTWGKNLMHVQSFSQFFTDAAAGQLPSVTYVEGTDLSGGVSPDEDPPADMQLGQAMVASVVNAVMQSPQWPKTAVLFSFDEQAGLYDHVPPPAACAPDDIPPILQPGDVQAGFDQLGLRVPLIAVSPYAKRGYVSHVVTDHTSVLRMVAARFELPALTHRDANAEPPFDLFDFTHPDLSIPSLPDATIDPAQQQACAAKYP